MAKPFIAQMPESFQTQLGRWFREDRNSGGEKIALPSFMRTGADILVLDEPTAAMDAEAEVRIFEHFRALTQNQMALLISTASRLYVWLILVLAAGELVEQGTHTRSC